MLAAPFLAAAAFLAGQEAPLPDAAPPDAATLALIDELIERSRAIKTFRAVLRVTPAGEPSTTIELDYVAPDAIRFDTLAGGDRVDSWCRGSWLCMRARVADRPWHARVDFGGIEAEMRPIEDELDRQFPPATPRADAHAGEVKIDASFDAAKGEGHLDCTCMVAAGVESPFGWLPPLRLRRGRFALDADHLLFHSEDGHVDFKFARKTGFLEEIVARGAKGSTTVTLESLIIDGTVDPARLELPTDAPEGPDHSESYREYLRVMTGQMERENLYLRIATALPAGPIDAAARARIETVLAALNGVEQRNRLDPFIATTKQWSDECAHDVGALRAAGRSDAELATWRATARLQLTQSIDYAAEPCATLPLPVHAGPADHDADLLALERAVATRLFEQRCRAPLLADFDQKTSAN